MYKNITIALTCMALILPASSFAQSFGRSSNDDDRIDRIERSLNVLERQVFKSDDDEKPFRQEVEYTGNNPEVRLSQIERKLRELTGAIEKMDFRLKKIERSSGITSSDSSGGQSYVSGTDETNTDTKPLNTRINEAEDRLDDFGTRSLGTTTSTRETIDLSGAGSKYEYDEAFALLRQAKYGAAAESFHEFIKKYPDDDLTSNAYYWLGETFYVQKDYEQASVAFLQGYQKDVKGSKAPDNLLKLAISLSAMEKRRESCATFDKLYKEFPDLSSSIKRRAEKEREEANCS